MVMLFVADLVDMFVVMIMIMIMIMRMCAMVVTQMTGRQRSDEHRQPDEHKHPLPSVMAFQGSVVML